MREGILCWYYMGAQRHLDRRNRFVHYFVLSMYTLRLIPITVIDPVDIGARLLVSAEAWCLAFGKDLKRARTESEEPTRGISRVVDDETIKA